MEGERKNAALLKEDSNGASHYHPRNEATRDKDNGKRAGSLTLINRANLLYNFN